MLQEELDHYWKLLETELKPLSELEQRRISHIFCLLVENDLDQDGKGALKFIEELSLGKKYTKKYELCQKKLQEKLPKENALSPYSVLIWSLMENSSSYPPWYAAGIAGLNLVDLGKATLPELTKLVKENIRSL